jgi:hypothetical protein
MNNVMFCKVAADCAFKLQKIACRRKSRVGKSSCYPLFPSSRKQLNPRQIRLCRWFSAVPRLATPYTHTLLKRRGREGEVWITVFNTHGKALHGNALAVPENSSKTARNSGTVLCFPHCNPQEIASCQPATVSGRDWRPPHREKRFALYAHFFASWLLRCSKWQQEIFNLCTCLEWQGFAGTRVILRVLGVSR